MLIYAGKKSCREMSHLRRPGGKFGKEREIFPSFWSRICSAILVTITSADTYLFRYFLYVAISIITIIFRFRPQIINEINCIYKLNWMMKILQLSSWLTIYLYKNFVIETNILHFLSQFSCVEYSLFFLFFISLLLQYLSFHRS